METADAGGENHADTVLVEVLVVEVGIVDGLAGSHEGIHGVEVERAGLLAVEMLRRIEILELAGKLGLELRGVEMGDGAGAADSVNSVIPAFRHVLADRGKRA